MACMAHARLSHRSHPTAPTALFGWKVPPEDSSGGERGYSEKAPLKCYHLVLVGEVFFVLFQYWDWDTVQTVLLGICGMQANVLGMIFCRTRTFVVLRVFVFEWKWVALDQLKEKFLIMWDVRVCAACLATDVRMYSMRVVGLLEPYRLLTGIEVQSEGMPQKLCWECAALVHKFNMFRHKCERASLLLQDIYNQHDEVLEQDVLRINREEHNLISSYTICPIQIHNLELKTKTKKSHKDKTSEEKKLKDSQTDNAPNDHFVKLEINMKKEECPIEMKSESNDTELIDEVFAEEDCSQAMEMESTQKCVKITKKIQHSKPKEKKEIKARDFGMREELLSQEQQMEVMREKQNTKAYKSARFPCTLCYNYFSEEKAFNNHMLKHDPVSGEFICDLCKMRYKSRRFLYTHIRCRHMKRYSCQLCPEVFCYRNAAQKHSAWHNGVVYTCRICLATYKRNTTYQSHLRLKHPMGEVCNQCGEPFHSKKGLLQHINITHKLKRGTIASGGEQETSGPYCAECDIQFTCKQAWTRHILISPKHQHERHICALGCEACGETLPDEESLQFHRVTHRITQPRHQTTAKPITCEQCGEVMESHSKYIAHFRCLHPDKTRKYCPTLRRPCMCELCGKVFKSKGALKLHSYKHTGERPFKCDVCSKRFISHQRLQLHTRSHTKETPYKCDICGRGFSSPSNFLRHKTVHMDTRPYSCDICGKSFKTRVCMKSHIEYIHLKKPWPKRDRSQRQNVNKQRSKGDKRKLLEHA